MSTTLSPVHGLQWLGEDKVELQHTIRDWIHHVCGEDPEWETFLLYELWSELLYCHEPSMVLEMMEKKRILWNHGHFEKIRQRFSEQDTFIEAPPMIEEGIMPCRKCKSKQTFSFSKQTRRSDEGTTVFVRCLRCQFTYRM